MQLSSRQEVQEVCGLHACPWTSCGDGILQDVMTAEAQRQQGWLGSCLSKVTSGCVGRVIFQISILRLVHFSLEW